MIREIIENWKQKNMRFKEMEEEDRMVNKLQQRKLGHNERELNKFMEEERQKQITNDLKLAKLKRRWEDKQQEKNMMNFNSGLFNEDVIFTQENMFLK